MRSFTSIVASIVAAVVLLSTLLSSLAFAQTPDTKTYWTVPDDVPIPTVEQIVISATIPDSGSPALADGYIFFSPHEKRIGRSPYAPTELIVDNDGELVYYRQFDGDANHSRFDDFKVLDNGLLVSWVGAYRKHQFQDSSYNVVGTVQTADGPASDLHDIALMPNGNYMLMIYHAREVDVSDLVEGGATDLTYIDCWLQEINPAGEKVFEWHSEDHYAITDTHNSLLKSIIDGPHCNSIDVDTDGHLLLSSRDHYEVTKINRESGEIIWRLGGKNNQFEFINEIDADDLLFEKQHDARRVPNGNLTLFDNRTEEYSRAVEYELDEENMTAKLVWSYRYTPNIFGAILGNAQRLPNGNTLISWGNAPRTLSEVTRDGVSLFEMHLPIEMVTYRSYRFPWVGRPTTSPDLVVVQEIISNTQPISTTSIHLAYSWNGATEVSSYQLYADASTFPETLVATQPREGFETTTTITQSEQIATALDMGYNFRVVPLDSSGAPFTKTITGTIAGNPVENSVVISSITQSITDAIIITATSTPTPTPTPTPSPTVEPTPSPTPVPPTLVPTIEPTEIPTEVPTEVPTEAPTEVSTEAPTEIPTIVATDTVVPTSASPTDTPVPADTSTPTTAPTLAPTVVVAQTPLPTATQMATDVPTEVPTEAPTVAPTLVPTLIPTIVSTVAPTDPLGSADSSKIFLPGILQR